MVKYQLNKHIIDNTFFKFILVGIINTIVGSSIMFVMYNLLGFSYWISSSANYIIGSIISYYLNKKYTFQNKEKGFQPIIKFSLNILICYSISYGIAKPIIYMLFSNKTLTAKDNLAMIAGMCIFVIINYLGQKFFAFKN